MDSHNESNRIDSNRELECSTADRAVVGGPAGPAMAWPLFLPRIFLKYFLLFKIIAQLPPAYYSTSALHGRTTFQKPTTTLADSQSMHVVGLLGLICYTFLRLIIMWIAKSGKQAE